MRTIVATVSLLITLLMTGCGKAAAGKKDIAVNLHPVALSDLSCLAAGGMVAKDWARLCGSSDGAVCWTITRNPDGTERNNYACITER